MSGDGEKAVFVLEESGKPLPIAYKAKDIISALRAGDLYVDRILAYFIRCLLPEVVAVGGTSQQDYVALYQKMFLATHDIQPFLEETEVSSISNASISRLGGAALLELTNSEKNFLAYLKPNSSLESFFQPLLKRRVEDTIGELECARYFETKLDILERYHHEYSRY